MAYINPEMDNGLYVNILRALELFTTAVPPTLPLCITIGLENSV